MYPISALVWFAISCQNLADSDLVIIPYKLLNIRTMTLYGIITESLPADLFWASYSGVYDPEVLD